MAVCVSEIALAIRLRALAIFWGKKLPKIENVALVRIFQVGHVCNLNWLIIWTLFNNLPRKVEAQFCLLSIISSRYKFRTFYEPIMY